MSGMTSRDYEIYVRNITQKKIKDYEAIPEALKDLSYPYVMSVCRQCDSCALVFHISEYLRDVRDTRPHTRCKCCRGNELRNPAYFMGRPTKNSV